MNNDPIEIYIYRIQDSDGRGPWKPGFSKNWTEDRPESEYEKLIPWPYEFGPVHKKAQPCEYLGCGCLTIDQLRQWFTPNEYRTLMKYGYRATKMPVCRILAKSNIQCVFTRVVPLQTDVEFFDLY